MALNWRLILGGLPPRCFTAAELARAIPDPPDRSLQAAVAFNIVLMIGTFTVAFGGTRKLALAALLLPFGLIVALALRAAWRDPGSRAARAAHYAMPFTLGLALGIAAGVLDLERDAAIAVAAAAVSASLAQWFAIVYRHKFVEMRLRELDERDRAVEMARQLAAAQIQPHFLFNSLASLQHWVRAKDDRAALLLESLTGYLRATLPLFERRSLRLGDEVDAAARYLDVMRLRLGERLRHTIDVEPAASEAVIPPGVLLTLVENAIEHGVMPSLHGAEVRIEARVAGDRLVIDVVDTGAGPAPGAADGTGLANTRARLRQAHGDAATLSLSDAPGGGCRARVILPLLQEAPP